MKKKRMRVGSLELLKYITVLNFTKAELERSFTKFGIRTFDRKDAFKNVEGRHWQIVKWEPNTLYKNPKVMVIGKLSKECCYTVATIEWYKDDEYNIVSCGRRLVDLDPKDMLALKIILDEFVDPCINDDHKFNEHS